MTLPPYRMDYSPIIARPRIRWPNDARVAFWVAPNVEHYEYLPSLDGVRNPWPRVPHPDVQQYSAHEYGNRVGFWRVLEVLDRYNIRYVCDWTNDEQPYPLHTPPGGLAGDGSGDCELV